MAFQNRRDFPAGPAAADLTVRSGAVGGGRLSNADAGIRLAR